ncbi:MAG: SoxR reducing system RseC family protein [Spirochaetes bacterium]|jgi:positive regulator of sigma E activity|nr:SoxR reducing system RseC family protein [Spirochaetota bacterium]
MASCETGTVIAVNGDEYIVAPDEQEGCGSCKHKKSCHGSSDNDSVRELVCHSLVPVRSGDKVEFEITFPFIYISVLLYLGPAVLILAGAFIGYRFITFFSDSDLNVLIGIIAVLPFIALILFLKQHTQPVANIIRRIGEEKNL